MDGWMDSHISNTDTGMVHPGCTVVSQKSYSPFPAIFYPAHFAAVVLECWSTSVHLVYFFRLPTWVQYHPAFNRDNTLNNWVSLPLEQDPKLWQVSHQCAYKLSNQNLATKIFKLVTSGRTGLFPWRISQRGSLGISALCACVYIYIQQLRFFRAPKL